MEIRFSNARATKDIDLTFMRSSANSSLINNDQIMDVLQTSAQRDLSDFFVYQVGEIKKDLVTTPYGGARFPITALIGHRLFIRFNIDVGVGSILGEIEEIEGTDWLHFCEIPAPRFPMISIEQQLAEKFHAYLVPRGERENTRVKDLVDMLLLVRGRPLNYSTLQKALKRVFDLTTIPTQFPTPPESWDAIYRTMATKCGIIESMTGAFEQMRHRWSEIVGSIVP